VCFILPNNNNNKIDSLKQLRFRHPNFSSAYIFNDMQFDEQFSNPEEATIHLTFI
jgi:hypothetical protein